MWGSSDNPRGLQLGKLAGTSLHSWCLLIFSVLTTFTCKSKLKLGKFYLFKEKTISFRHKADVRQYTRLYGVSSIFCLFTQTLKLCFRFQKIELLCAVMGINYGHDPDDSYELTGDNVKKILAIYMRFRCNIPVIIMGETGCGKTKLIRYLCGLQTEGVRQRNMLLMKVKLNFYSRFSVVIKQLLEICVDITAGILEH